MSIRHARSIALSVAAILIFAGTVGQADDGYRLWLKYDPIADQAESQSYRQAFSAVVVEGDSPTLNVVREEIARGLNGLLDTSVSFPATVNRPGTLVIATPDTSPIIGMLGWDSDLRRLGREGGTLFARHRSTAIA